MNERKGEEEDVKKRERNKKRESIKIILSKLPSVLIADVVRSLTSRALHYNTAKMGEKEGGQKKNNKRNKN